MKTQLRAIAMASLFVMASCSEDQNITTNENEQESEALEPNSNSNSLRANTIFDNVLIGGGTKKEGVPPTPNEGITLDISNSRKSAFLREGFEINLESDSLVTGAYIVFKSDDGTLSNGYYDVDLDANILGLARTATTPFQGPRGLGRTGQNAPGTPLDVDFNENIAPGSFCYIVYAYDIEGNISAPQELCITIEEWGGFANLVGDWFYLREERRSNSGFRIVEAGVANCLTQTDPCDGTGTIEITSCYTVDNANLSLKEDGTYTFLYTEVADNIDYEATYTQCELVQAPNDITYTYESTGNWAFSTLENRLTLLTYDTMETEGGEIVFAQTYPTGEAIPFLDGTVRLTDTSLILTQITDYVEGSTNGVSVLYFD